MSTAMLTGKVIRFDEVRGYGFVAPDSGTEDVFLHVNDLHFDKRLLVPGARVQFFAEEGERGLKASQVRMLAEPPVAATHPVVTVLDGADDELCDILSVSELVTECTESLLASVATLTADQIVDVRDCVVAIAKRHGWVE